MSTEVVHEKMRDRIPETKGINQLPKVARAPVKTEGVALESIDKGKKGKVLLETDEQVYVAKLFAENNIPKYGHVLTVSTESVIWTSSKLMIKQGYVNDDYAKISYGTDSYTEYVIGSAAHKADSEVPKFTAELLKLTPTTICKVKFNRGTRVAHNLGADEQKEYYRKCSKLWVKGTTSPGELEVIALG